MTYLALAILFFWLVKGLELIVGVLFLIPALKKPSFSPHPFPASGSIPKVSIIFGAKDEEHKIRDAVLSMIQQDYPHFEVIAVNDRSTDSTVAILGTMPKSERFRVVNITHLPEGWLGKTHALYQGYQLSSGDWLLFTDADVQFDSSTLRSAINAVQKYHLDHLVLYPRLMTKSYVEAIFIHTFTFFFYLWYRPWAARFRYDPAFVGIGSFNLVKRSIYEAIGTHQDLALQVADDMMLGKRIKSSGYRQMLMNGQELLTEHWVEGFQGVMDCLRKNAFAGLHYSIPFLVFLSFMLFLFDILPFIGVFFAGPPASYFFMVSAGMIFLIYGVQHKFDRQSLATFPAHPLGSLLMLAIMWRSALTILKEGGVWWRDTFYPLELLKEAGKNH